MRPHRAMCCLMPHQLRPMRKLQRTNIALMFLLHITVVDIFDVVVENRRRTQRFRAYRADEQSFVVVPHFVVNFQILLVPELAAALFARDFLPVVSLVRVHVADEFPIVSENLQALRALVRLGLHVIVDVLHKDLEGFHRHRAVTALDLT